MASPSYRRKSYWQVALLAPAAALLSLFAAAQQPPPTLPIPRIDTPMHTALVRKLVYDSPRDRILTASDDKTVRLWQLPQGRLLRVFRVPIAQGFEGRLYVADISPDGRTVAAAGWTGWDFDGQGAIYIFDAESGEIIRRIGGFPETIGAVSFSPDGRSLAVGIQGANGLRILRTSDYAEVASDWEYGNRILDIGFSGDGRLAVASLDGYVRLYDPSFRLIGRRKTTTGQQPLSIKFSPDGKLIAIGFSDLAPPAIYRASDLQLAYPVDASAIRQQRKLQNIHWNDSGDTLYATGEQQGGEVGRIYRWRLQGKGPTETIEIAAQRPGGLWPLKNGRMAFATEDPYIGILSPSGEANILVPSDIADLRSQAMPLSISRDGTVIEFQAQGTTNRKSARLDVKSRSAEQVSDPSTEMLPPRLRSERFQLSGLDADSPPTLNGARIALDDFEVSRSYAIAADDSILVLGTEWSVRAFDQAANPRWRYRASGVVWQVSVTADTRTVVAALSDGTLRWLRAEDGVEYLAAFVRPKTLEWIAWTPQGYYVSSIGGDQLLGWHINQGREQAPLFFRAVQFERLLYRPDVVDAALTQRDPDPKLTGERGFQLVDLIKIAPPVVNLTTRADNSDRTRIKIDARAIALAMQDLTVFVNNVPVTRGRDRPLPPNESRRLAREVQLSLPPGESTVRIEISNGRSIGTAELKVDSPAVTIRPSASRGNLYVLSIGVNRFPMLRQTGRRSPDLEFAARDAIELSRFFAEHATGYFERVLVRTLTDEFGESPTRRAVVGTLDFLADSGERDTAVLFLASHGVSDPSGNYYFVPSDARIEDWLAIEDGKGTAPSLVSWTVFFDALRQTAGRRILIVDTCHAQSIEGRIDLHSLTKRSASSLFSMVVASKGNESSQEYRRGRHGLFTYGLLEALRSDRADADGDGFVTLAEVFQAALPIIEKLRNPRAGPQTPQLVAPSPLEKTILLRAKRREEVGRKNSLASPSFN